MPLAAGTRLGAYDVAAPIGAGGMGEVYRARDTRLDRDVAIKVLPTHLAGDEVARARFEREAKAVAALSHPNILAIHDTGVQDGVAFVVMELLEGETLRQRLNAAGSALPMRKVTGIGTEIAQGLAAAHDKQIVHRDLKPENIFLATDGRVKILDFGLARQAPAAAGVTETPTQLQHTDPGTVMGTVGYMSPEQVKGLPADHRADIFSLGCVLYEMASGRRAFARDTAAETMTAVLRDDPPDLAGDHAAIPAAFEPVVRHCLEKRPEERFQSARDLAFALQSIGTASSASGGVPMVEAASAEHATSGARRRAVVAALAIAGAALVFGLGRYTAGEAPHAAGGPHITEFQQVTDVAGVETTPTLSPDGRTVVYASDRTGSWQLYSLRLGSRAAVTLTTDSQNSMPAFSPDGERIAFRSSRDGGGIFLMTASGESVTRVSDTGYSPAWSPDGRELVVSPSAFASPADLGQLAPGLVAIDVKSGRRRDLMTGNVALQPAWSPNGHRIAYFGLRADSGQRDIWTVATSGTAAGHSGDEVTNDAALDWSPVWSPDGDYLYFSSNRGGTMNLWRVAIDERSGRLRSEPEPVTTPSSWSGPLSFSRDGSRMAFASLDWRTTLQRQRFDPAREALVGPPTPLLKGSRPIRDHDMSPDGQWVAFNESGSREDLFVARIDGTEYRRLTDDAARDRGPTWSPDGGRIAFYSDRGGGYDLWTIRPDGSQLAQVTQDASANFSVWSPDGARIAFNGLRATGLTIVGSASAAALTSATEPRLNATDQFWPFSWSADRARLLGTLVSTSGLGSTGVFTYDIASRQYRQVPATLASAEGWLLPAWLADGRRFLVRSTDGIFLVHAETGAVRQLVAVRGYMIGRSLSVARDDTSFSYSETGTEGDIWVAMLATGSRPPPR